MRRNKRVYTSNGWDWWNWPGRIWKIYVKTNNCYFQKSILQNKKFFIKVLRIDFHRYFNNPLNINVAAIAGFYYRKLKCPISSFFIEMPTNKTFFFNKNKKIERDLYIFLLFFYGQYLTFVYFFLLCHQIQILIIQVFFLN